MIQGMSGRKNVGRRWIVRGSVWRGGKRIRHTKKTVTVSSEDEIEKAEHAMRDKLDEEYVRTQGDIGELKIKVDSEVE